MKTMFKLLTLAVLMALFTLTVLADGPITDAPIGGDVQPVYTCPEHHFEGMVTYVEGTGQHRVYCTTTNCTSFKTEDCYNRAFCGDHHFEETLRCQVCNRGSIRIHNEMIAHLPYDPDFYHAFRCVNMNASQTLYCDRRYVDLSPCSLDERYIWRSYSQGNGHLITEICSGCKYEYSTGYFNPMDHNDGYDSSCSYCTQDEYKELY